MFPADYWGQGYYGGDYWAHVGSSVAVADFVVSLDHRGRAPGALRVQGTTPSAIDVRGEAPDDLRARGRGSR